MSCQGMPVPTATTGYAPPALTAIRGFRRPELRMSLALLGLVQFILVPEIDFWQYFVAFLIIPKVFKQSVQGVQAECRSSTALPPCRTRLRHGGATSTRTRRSSTRCIAPPPSWPEKLKAFGCDEVVPGIGKTGVVGVIKGRKAASGKVIGLRADMDALPMTELTGLPYAPRRRARCTPAAMTATQRCCSAPPST